MAKITLTTHQTDGSNGYEPGTWEWRITVEKEDTWDMCFDGGWPSEAIALEAGQAKLRELTVSCTLCGKLVMLWDTYSPADEAICARL